MHDMVRVGALPAAASPLDIVKQIVLSNERLIGKSNQWRAAVWQFLINSIARTHPQLNLPPFEVARVSCGRLLHDDGELVAAVRPLQGPQTEMVLVYFRPHKQQPPRLICREAEGGEFASCFNTLMSEEPLTGTQLFAIETRVAPIMPWGENHKNALGWLEAYNKQVDDPEQLPMERFKLVRVAYERQHGSNHTWLVGLVRSERSGIDMVLEYYYGGPGDSIRCRPPKIGELSMRNFSRILYG